MAGTCIYLKNGINLMPFYSRITKNLFALIKTCLLVYIADKTRPCPIPWAMIYMVVKGWFLVLIFHYYALTSDAFSSIFQGNPVSKFYFDTRPARTITRSTLTIHFPRITCASFDTWQTRVCQTYRRHTSAIRVSWTLTSISELSDSSPRATKKRRY